MIYDPLSPREPSVGESVTPQRERYYQTANEVRLLRARIQDCPRETFSENRRIWESLREVVDERLRNAAEADRARLNALSSPSPGLPAPPAWVYEPVADDCILVPASLLTAQTREENDPVLLAGIDQNWVSVAAGKSVLWSELKREEGSDVSYDWL